MLLANIQYIPESIFVKHFRHYDEHFIPYKRLQKAIKCYKKTFNNCHHQNKEWGIFDEEDVKIYRHFYEHKITQEFIMNYELDKVSHTLGKTLTLTLNEAEENDEEEKEDKSN